MMSVLPNASTTKASRAALVVHSLAWIGVAFWAWMVIKRIIEGWPEESGVVVVLAVVLGGSHVLISRFTSVRSEGAIWMGWFVLIADLSLSIFINPLALVLVGATIVILAASYMVKRA